MGRGNAVSGGKAQGRVVVTGGVASERMRAMAVLAPPVVLPPSASKPLATLFSPVMLLNERRAPVAVLNWPVVLE